MIDRGLVLWFPGPSSETGEDMAELQLHGGRAVVQAVFDVLGARGLRLAEPGEFIRRAFQNGKLDLTEVEGLADLIAAETEVQLCQAARPGRRRAGAAAPSVAGDAAGSAGGNRGEARFFRRGGRGGGTACGFRGEGRGAAGRNERGDSGAASGERVREGFRVAILGLPNAGKSSLLNALARRDVAIVTREPGTTRDVLEVPLDLRGYPVLLFDTAGLREGGSKAEPEGVRRAKRTAESADLVLWLEEAALPSAPLPPLPDRPVWRAHQARLGPAAPAAGSGDLGRQRRRYLRTDREARESSGGIAG